MPLKARLRAAIVRGAICGVVSVSFAEWIIRRLHLEVSR
jgi:hypothetical protein